MPDEVKKKKITCPSHTDFRMACDKSQADQSTILNNGTLLQLLRRETLWLLN